MSTPETSQQLETLARFPEALGQQVQPLSDTLLRYKPAGEWSAIENVGHLIDIDVLWLARIRQMLAAETPTMAAINVDQSVLQHNYQHKQLVSLLHTHAENRAELIAFLRTLKPMHMERVGIHPTRGPLTVAQSIGVIVWHDGAHTEQIAKTVAEGEQAGG